MEIPMSWRERLTTAGIIAVLVSVVLLGVLVWAVVFFRNTL
jgi:hypothetical protein